MPRHESRILLKPMEPEDAAHIERWFYSGNYPYFFRDMPLMTREQLKSYASFKDGQAFMLWRHPPQSAPNPVGIICLYDIHSLPANLKFGVLIDQMCQEAGYAFEATKQIIEYAFHKLHFVKIIAEVIESNERTTELLERGGFRREAVLEREANYRGMLTDVIRYALFRDEYEAKLKEGFYTQE